MLNDRGPILMPVSAPQKNVFVLETWKYFVSISLLHKYVASPAQQVNMHLCFQYCVRYHKNNFELGLRKITDMELALCLEPCLVIGMSTSPLDKAAR